MGAIGRLPSLACHVDQVVSENELLVRCFFKVPVVTVRNFVAHRETVTRPVEFLIQGIETQRVQEGGDLALPQVFEVAGRQTYDTTAGRSKRLLVLKTFDMKSLEPYFTKPTGVD